MQEQLFYDALQLLSENEIVRIRESKLGLISVSRTMAYEKVLGSVNALKTIHNRHFSVKSKAVRNAYIEEKLLPAQIDTFKYYIIDNFIEVKNGSILRIKDLQIEQSRLNKLTSEHDLKSKSMLRALSKTYEEERKISEYLEIVNAAEVLYDFFRSRKIVYYNLTEIGRRKLYNQYMSGGE